MKRVIPPKLAQQAVDAITALIEPMPVRRVEQIGKRCIMEQYSDPRTGLAVFRVTLTISDGAK